MKEIKAAMQVSAMQTAVATSVSHEVGDTEVEITQAEPTNEAKPMKRRAVRLDQIAPVEAQTELPFGQTDEEKPCAA
jgi:hypothetical protein